MALSYKQLILDAVHACADAAGGYVRYSMGTPGVFFKLRGERVEAGRAFDDLPKTLDCLVDGIGTSFETLGKSVIVNGMVNDSGFTLPTGTFVRLTGNNTFGPTTSPGSVSNLLGCLVDSTPTGQQGSIIVAGLARALTQTGLIITPGTIMTLSAVAGRVDVGSPTPVGMAVDTSEYAGSALVTTLLRVPLQ